ncbi:hybrid sensor histidine kinase/response regulator [Sporobolomyces koalae]|uniref:hybrid sensor histidine kinase/response regulator n=1 Tax=Sporobolomyces koalae TaxID=500713 RepID=UPI00317C91BF
MEVWSDTSSEGAQQDAAQVGSSTGRLREDVGEEPSFVEWLEMYSIGRTGSPALPPAPPAAIQAILGDSTPASASTSRSDKSSGQVSFSLTLSHGSDRSSLASSNDSVPSSGPLWNPAVSEQTAADLLEYFQKNRVFPAPPGPWEEERLQLAMKYGLDKPVRRKAIDRICAIAKRHFKTKMVIVSLTLDDYQLFGAERGISPDGEPQLDDPPRRVPVEPAFCTHAMAASYRDPKSVFIVSNANTDWRFRTNPNSTGMGGAVSFYAAATVNLPVGEEARKTGLPSTLASGALCLMDPERTMGDPSDFSAEDRVVLTDLAEMIAREFKLGFEQRRREEEMKQSTFLGEFLQQALVQPALPGSLNSAQLGSSGSRASPVEPKGSKVPPTQARARAHSSTLPRQASHLETSTPTLFATAASKLVELTRANSCGILDLRGFKASIIEPLYHRRGLSVVATPSHSPPRSSSPGPTSSRNLNATVDLSSRRHLENSRKSRKDSQAFDASGGKERRGKIGLMASEGDIDWPTIVKRSTAWQNRYIEGSEPAATTDDDGVGDDQRDDPLVAAVEETLRASAAATSAGDQRAQSGSAFSAHAIFSDDTVDSCCIPIIDVDGTPALMIVLSSSEKWFRFEHADGSFARSIGAVLLGSLLRERARESDLAKLAFISQVSHEIRTPLFGVHSQLELIREFSSATELRKLSPLLDVADICAESLSDVLNDVLDFAKVSNSAELEDTEPQDQRLAKIDLSHAIDLLLKSVWIRKKRIDLASIDLGEAHSLEKETASTKLDLILEIDAKEDGWEVMTDVGGLQRVLLNIVGNALKFTKTGHVKVMLRYLGRTAPQSPNEAPSEDKDSSAALTGYRGYIAFVVEDTGVGMSPEFLRKGALFTPFKQEDSFSTGAGLGLSICESIVRRLGPGRIDVASQEGIGTRITVTLPIDFVGHEHGETGPTSGCACRPSASRKIISDELEALLRTSPNLPAPTILVESVSGATAQPSSSRSMQSPACSGRDSLRSPDINFSEAVAAVQASLLPTSASTNGSAKPTPDQDDLAVETAKLAISSTQPIESSIIPMASPPKIEEDERAQLDLNSGPVSVPAVSNAIKTATPATSAAKASVAPDVRVLFADDNPLARNILTKLLTGKGINFVAAEDGQQAVDHFKAAQGDIALCILDVQMPIKDGIGAAHDIRALEEVNGWKRCKIIALTGLANESDMAEAIVTGGIDSWLVKGGKSLRIIMDEIVNMQQDIERSAVGEHL